MTAVKLAQAAMALIAIACIAFGYGTAWFVVGMFAAIASLILDGLLRYLTRKSLLEQFDDWYAAVPQHMPPVVSETGHRPPVVLTVIEGGKRPTWPSEIGGIE